MIAKDAEEAAELTEQLLKDKSVIDVYDEVLVPAMSLAEEGRHAGFLDSETQVYFLENTRELVDEIGTRGASGPGENRISAKIICLPAKDAADELACQILAQLLPSAAVQVVRLGISTNDLVKAISTARPTVVCISGVPPQATRHVAVRCRHLRKLFPDLTILAAVWSDADLTSVRSRIPVSDANHVVCTLKQAIEYIANIENPISTTADSTAKPADDQATEEQISALDLLDTSNTPIQDVLDRIVQDLAKTLNAPISVLTVTDEAGKIWKSQSGLPSDLATGVQTIEQLVESSIGNEKSTVIIEDMASDQRFASSPLLSEKGIHFCAGEPLLNRNGKVLGSLLVLDTRTRNISQQEEELLHTAAKAAVEALEVRAIEPPAEPKIRVY
jgi:GAF domain